MIVETGEELWQMNTKDFEIFDKKLEDALRNDDPLYSC